MKFLIALLLLFPTTLFAQDKENLMYSSGRIYVVVSVLLIILIGIFILLIRIEKKIKKLEQADKDI